MSHPLTLLLVPTEFELVRLEQAGGFAGGRVRLELCGFGPIAAAARTAQLVAQHSPEQVLLVGIAGSYDSRRPPPGSAWSFREVALEGLSTAVFPQWPAREGQPAIRERIALRPGRGACAELLVTVCSTSASTLQAEERRERFPGAAAEDMEGFGVALACALARVPCTIVRGISNSAGCTDHAHWRTDEALAAARTLALQELGAGAHA